MVRWTKEEEGYLRRNYPVHRVKKMVQVLGRSEKAIRWKANQLGITRAIRSRPKRGENKNPWTDDECLRLLELHNTGMAIEEIAEDIGRTVWSCHIRLNYLTGVYEKKAQELTCKIIYEGAQETGGDPESLFANKEFVRDFVGRVCERYERGDIEFKEYDGPIEHEGFASRRRKYEREIEWKKNGNKSPVMSKLEESLKESQQR